MKMKETKTEVINKDEYVDLGLPSGNLWCIHNVLAEKPEDYGKYFLYSESNKYGCNTTKEDYEELTNCTVIKNEILNGVKGIRLYSKVDSSKSIFIPFSGKYCKICGSEGFLGVGNCITLWTTSFSNSIQSSYCFWHAEGYSSPGFWSYSHKSNRLPARSVIRKSDIKDSSYGECASK